MQEEVEQKTIALSVRTARMTADMLQRAMRKFLEAQKQKAHEESHGKQTLKGIFIPVSSMPEKEPKKAIAGV